MITSSHRFIPAALAVLLLGAAVALPAKETALQRKLRTIVVDQIELDDAPLSTVVAHLRDLAKRLDPDKKGVNLILMSNPEPGVKEPNISIHLTDVPLGEVIRYVCTAANYQYRIDEFAVVISPKPKEKKDEKATGGKTPPPARP